MNNVFFPELEKLSRKLNKAFEKKGAKYLLKKQKELNDNTIQISIALLNESVYLTYTKPTSRKNFTKVNQGKKFYLLLFFLFFYLIPKPGNKLH